jgi:hypothetical protein
LEQGKGNEIPLVMFQEQNAAGSSDDGGSFRPSSGDGISRFFGPSEQAKRILTLVRRKEDNTFPLGRIASFQDVNKATTFCGQGQGSLHIAT